MNEDYAKIISQNLKRIAYDHGKTLTDISHDLKISKSTLSCWMNGLRIPRMSNIDQLCHYFKVNRTDIMDPHEINESSDLYKSSISFTPEERDLILAYRRADNGRKESVRILLGVESRQEKSDVSAS